MSVTVRGVSVRYGPRLAVERVDLTAVAGRVLALVGPNGAGKSSLLRAIAGVVRHTGGVVTLGGPDAQRRVAYMPQDTSSGAALRVLEAVLVGRLDRLRFAVGRTDVDAIHGVLEDVGIADLAGRFLHELSGGQRQLVFLAQALAKEPEILLLDEPTAALDLRHQLEVLGLIRRVTRERELSTIVVLHDLNGAARFADTIALLHEGRLRAVGDPGAIVTPTIMRDVFGVEAHVARGADGVPTVTAIRPA